MARYSVFFLVALLLCSALVLADEANPFSISSTKIDNQITLNESAVFLITIRNNQDTSDRFEFHSPNRDSLRWDIYTQPLSDFLYLDIPAFGEKTIEFHMKPHAFSSPLEYVTLNAFSRNTKQMRGVRLKIFVKQAGPPPVAEYVPNVYSAVELSEPALDPRKPLTITFYLDNRNPLSHPQLKLVGRSDFFSFERNISLASGPNTRKTEEFSVDLLDTQTAGDYKAYFAVMRGNLTLYETTKVLNVIPYTEFVETKDERSAALLKTVTLSYTNRGNTGRADIITYPTSFVGRWFTSTDPKAVVEKQNGRRYFIWKLELGPMESSTVTVTTNYRPLFYGFLILAGIVVIVTYLYFTYRSPVVVRRLATTYGGNETISQVKVLLYIRNRSNQSMEQVQILERLPRIVEPLHDTSPGTIQPEKMISNDTKGALLKWSLPTLEAHEERIISYKMKSKLEVLGDITLPSTIVKYVTPAGMQKVVSSSRTLVQNK
ncbi:hypothetical protein HZB01_04775 [Candidatus Woesearchaeota archaeon]|nr:hypothetical protein [Candidatus Woesearchaeota archaeon]